MQRVDFINDRWDAFTFPSSTAATHLVIWALMGAEDTPMNTPNAVEAKNTSSDLAKTFTILMEIADPNANKMMILSFRLK